MRDEKVSRAIIVVQKHMTPFARQSLLETNGTKYHMEQFLEPARALSARARERRRNGGSQSDGSSPLRHCRSCW